MYAAKSMMFDLTDLTRRAAAARGFVPLRSDDPGPAAKARRAFLIAVSIGGCASLFLVALLFLSAILDF
jgi:hypothetical protein